MKATKIKMKQGCAESNNVQEIDSIFLEVTGIYHKKEQLHDYLLQNPNTIQVNIYPYPNLIPAKSIYGERYVRSEANDTKQDNLLKLPRQ